MRIVQISDTHLTHKGGVTNENFAMLVEYVNDVLKPDLVINTGDLVILSPDSEEDREFARAAHEGFDAPVLIVPGNHDVGMPGDDPWMGISTTSDRVFAYRNSFGSDRFVELPDSTWAIIGFNSELLSSGLEEEDEQWQWLERVAQEVRGRCVALFLHRPLWSPMPEVTDHELALPDADRERILGIFSDSRLRLVASGHLHRYMRAEQDETLTISAPSSAFIVRGGSLGINQLGVVEYRIEGERLDAYFRSVPSLVEDEPFALAAFTETLADIEAAREEAGVN
jgi:3',5'-cyclic AMP phosphodiesterase CpdA